MCGYHTTVKPWTAGETEAREILGLTKEDSELRRRSLDTIEKQELQIQMSCAIKWPERASRMRLIQSSKESEIAGGSSRWIIQARSQVDQEWMQAVMTRVLLRARWMDKVCHGMFFGWKMAYDRHRATERQLETATRSLDGARRSAYNDRQLLLEFRSQSQRLQDEMAEGVERLQDQLTEAEEEIDQVRSNLIVLKRQAYDDKEKYDLSMQTSEVEQKLGASC